jgi:hypothetical protein
MTHGDAGGIAGNYGILENGSGALPYKQAAGGNSIVIFVFWDGLVDVLMMVGRSNYYAVLMKTLSVL